jgi:hypothetical protein
MRSAVVLRRESVDMRCEMDEMGEGRDGEYGGHQLREHADHGFLAGTQELMEAVGGSGRDDWRRCGIVLGMARGEGLCGDAATGAMNLRRG